MKKFLLSEKGNFYKANLHCHSNISDGKLTPEELKKAYMDHGYSIIAYTDHDVLLPHTELCDEKFLALHGFEVELSTPLQPDDPKGKRKQRCHLCYIALEQDNLTQICWHRSKYLFGNAVNYRDQVKFDENEPDYVRSMTPECVNDMIKRGKEAGFFVTFNHPIWSRESYNNYTAYRGMDAMEIYNHSSAQLGYEEYCYLIYDQMIDAGEKIYCIAADDNHNKYPIDSPNCDSFGGFIWIKAENLEYRTITKALKDGNFYASQGPEIYDLWYEDGVIHVTCSDAVKVSISSSSAQKAKAFHTEENSFINEADFPIEADDGYLRITVTDKRGNRAMTSAYSAKELIKN